MWVRNSMVIVWLLYGYCVVRIRNCWGAYSNFMKEDDNHI